ncbi:MAG TPA: hypothetical protein PLH39_12855, partial [Promineifilum sp.]|nr:hypothetical protein [Promineifilum sp.]
MNVKRRLLFLPFLLVMAACAPSGAADLTNPPAGPAPETAAAATEGEIVQLVYQDWRTDWFPGMAQEQLAKFHATHPNIRVFYTPDPEDVPGEMPAMFQSGSAPDVISGCC